MPTRCAPCACSARSLVEAARHNGTGPANKIRHALGLNDYDETDVS
jgi:bacterioferritin-associated ferredoxin